MDHEPSIKEFLVAVWRGWGDRMSGRFYLFGTVVVAIVTGTLGVVLESVEGRMLTAAIALSAIAFTVYPAWAAERSGKRLLQERLMQKLKCSFGANIAGCVRHNVIVTWRGTDAVTGKLLGSVRGTYYRLAIESSGIGIVRQCSARIAWINRNSERCFDGEKIILSWVPAEHP